MDDNAIRVESVFKSFVLPHERSQSVKGSFTRLFRGVHSGAENQQALRDVSFEIKKGEFFGIAGRNGSGKSTLLKILAGIYQPTKGQVTVEGRLVPFIELGVGFNPELTGRENLYLNGALLGFSKKEVLTMYDEIVAFAELERFMDQKLKNYSSGMQVRLAFSLAVRAQADILLIDEVLAVGDADFQRKCFHYFRALKKQKTTVVFVTHDMGALREYCDRAILIDQSEVIAKGGADDIAQRYTQLFIEKEVAEDAKKVHGERWGGGQARMDVVATNKRKYTEDDKEIIVSTRFTAQKDMQDPIIGFSIKDGADNVLFGTNTKIKKIRTGLVRAGESRELLWTVPNILADGRQYINATIEHNDAVTVADWWTDATYFTVRKTEQTAYHLTPSIEVKVKK